MRQVYFTVLWCFLCMMPLWLLSQTVNFTPNSVNQPFRTSLGREVQFRDWSVPSQGGQILSCQWSFPGGNPSVSTSRLPRVTYNTSGVYPVSLTIYDSNTGYHTLTRNNFVRVNNDTINTYVNCDRLFVGWNRIDPPPNSIITLQAITENNRSNPSFSWIPWGFGINPVDIVVPRVTTIFTVYGSDINYYDYDNIRIDIVSPSEIPLPQLNTQYSFCQGDVNAQICLNDPECGLNYTWMADSLGGTVLGSGECFNRQGNLAQNTGSTVYWVRAQTRYGYAYQSPSIPVTVTISSPTAVILSGNQSICAGASPILTLSPFNGNILRWEQSTDGGITFQTISHTQSVYIPPPLTQTTRYRVAVESNGNGCLQAYSTVVTVNIIPNSVGGNVTGDVTFCNSGSGMLTLNGH